MVFIFIERQAVLEILTLSECCPSDDREVVVLFIGECIYFFVLLLYISTADRHNIRPYIYVPEFDLLLRGNWMVYRGMESKHCELIGGCYLLYMLLHHHTTIQYKIFKEISETSGYHCGWADAVRSSKKGDLFSQVIKTEKSPHYS